jgi:hypothetical protein
MLGEFMEQNCPDVSVKVVIKHNSDWNEFIDAVSIFYFGVTVNIDMPIIRILRTNLPYCLHY